MKEKTLIITVSLCVLLCAFVLFFFRTSPVRKIWREYSVIYIEKNTDHYAVLDIFSEAGITGVISLSHVPFPPFSPFAPVQQEVFFDGFSRSDLQNAFFSDKAGLFRLYYIPEKETKKAIGALKNAGAVWGTVGSGGSRSTVSAAVCLLFLCLLFFAKNRLFFICSFFPLVCYAAAAPFYHSAAFVCLTGYGLFIVQKFWKRDGFFRITAVYTLSTLVPLVLLFVCAAVSGIRQIVLLCAATGASCSLTYVLYKVEILLRGKKSFNPALILSARMLSVKDIFRPPFALIPAACVCFFMILVLCNGAVFGKSAKTIYLPAPVRRTVQKDFSVSSYTQLLSKNIPDRLPDLTDFVHAFWFTHTYPFKKLTKPQNAYKQPVVGEKAEYADYRKDGQRLKEVMVQVAVFDSAYIESVLNLARGTEKNDRNVQATGGAEMLLAKQNAFMRTAYVRSDSIQSGTLVFVFTLTAFIYILSILSALGIKRL